LGCDAVIMLDTHVLMWWVNGDSDRISDDATAAIAAASQSGEIVISSISAWEIAMLVSRGALVALHGRDGMAGRSSTDRDHQICAYR